MSRHFIHFTLLVSVLPIFAGCEPYRVEYHTRPRYYSRLMDNAQDRVVLEDGTVLVFRTREQAERGEQPAAAGPSAGFQLREETPDGKVVLHAREPEHVVANTLDCLRLEEYELLWDQVVAEQTKLAYKSRDQGVEEFTIFMRKNRLDLARMLNRMLLGFGQQEIVVEGVGGGVTVARFWPNTAELFKFKRVVMVNEGFALKLLVIE